MKIYFRFLVLTLMLFFQGSASHAVHTYYVDGKNGSNFNSGTSEDAAFETIQKAAEVIQPGEVCIVKPGSYTERIHIRTSGTKDSPIIFRAASKGVVTRGFTVEAGYITIDGFEITSTDPKSWKDGAGIHLRGKGCSILNNYIHSVYLEGIRLGDDLTSDATSKCVVRGNRMIRCGQAGIQIAGQNNTIDNNEIAGTIQWSRTNPQNLGAVGLRFFGSGHVIRKNRIHDILLSDPENSQQPHIDCVQTWGPASNITFEDNDFSLGERNLNKQIAMLTEVTPPVKNITFRNNLFHDAFRGLNIDGSYDPRHPSPISEIYILNNTFAEITDNAFELHDTHGAKVFNNIFYNCTALFTDPRSQGGKLETGYNCYYRTNGKQTEGVIHSEGDLVNVNPRFQNAEKKNYMLKSSSPLKGRGKPLSGVNSSGRKLSKAKSYDIGANIAP
ncbi:MAG TPA: right-handed parallel beta-helix repeat-containing protein [Ignavibacteriales bacterium]|nr:right-handed parallel beta-helix repeat-containing protein [Ignavibacteriales bacterium]